MTMGWRRAQLLLAASTLMGASGCISWYSGSAPVVGESPAGQVANKPGAERTPISVDVSFEVVGMDAPAGQRQGAIDKLNGFANDAFEESGRFHRVSTGEGNYTMSIDVSDDGSPNIPLAVLSGLTLTIIPTGASDSFTIDATLRSKTGAVLGTHRVTEKMTTFIELFMLFGMPFAAPSTVEKKMWRDVMTELAVWSSATIQAQH